MSLQFQIVCTMFSQIEPMCGLTCSAAPHSDMCSHSVQPFEQGTVETFVQQGVPIHTLSDRTRASYLKNAGITLHTPFSTIYSFGIGAHLARVFAWGAAQCTAEALTLARATLGGARQAWGSGRLASAKHCPNGCRRIYMKSRASLFGHTETLMLLDCRSGNWFWRNFGPEGIRLFRVFRLRMFAKDGGCCGLVRCRIALLGETRSITNAGPESDTYLSYPTPPPADQKI